MKINYKNILLALFSLGWIAFFLYLSSCSANYHFGKFIKKGGTIDTTERVVEVRKTIKVNGKDSVILFELPCNCPEVQIPPTRQEIRYKYKIQRDSFETVRYVTKWKTKEIVKVAKTKSNHWLWFAVGLGLGLLMLIFKK